MFNIALLHAEPLGTEFTYQGRLADDSGPTEGLHDFQFQVFATESGGPPLGTYEASGVNVVNGLFTVDGVDFGSDIFKGDACWLEIEVRPAGGTYETLPGRQKITATPYALYALSASSVGDHSITSAKLAPGAVQVPQLSTVGAPSPGQVLGFNGSEMVWTTPDGTTADAWVLGGNGGTTAGVDFLGTTDAKALELKANNQRILRLEPTGAGPNLVGGSEGNTVGSNVVGATIGGGGYKFGSGIFAIDDGNRVSDNYGVVSGGSRNVAGNTNSSATDAKYATVGGGYSNAASGEQSTVAGGRGNAANGRNTTVGGGWVNQIVSADAATISGGEDNYVGTNIVDQTEFGAITNYAGYSVVGGGLNNRVSSIYSDISGGALNGMFGDYGTIGGGYANQMGDPRSQSAETAYGTIAGGAWNHVTALGGAIGGGQENSVQGKWGVIAGGIANAAFGQESAIGGGTDNIINSDARWSSIPGGAGARTRVPGQFAQACGKFSQNGDAQASTYVLRGATTGTGVFTSLLAAGSKIVVPPNTLMMFDIQLVGGSDPSLCLAQHIVGAIERTGTNPPEPTFPHTDASIWGPIHAPDWRVNVVADAAANALDILVAADPGRWVATVRTTEVELPDPSTNRNGRLSNVHLHKPRE